MLLIQIRKRYFVVLVAMVLIAGAWLNTTIAEVSTPSRKPWTESKIQGTPDRPPPFSLKRVYPELAFKGPVSIQTYPEVDSNGDKRLVVVEESGKIWSFVDKESSSQADLMMDFRKPYPKWSEIDNEKKGSVSTYSIAFHPKFLENRYVYVCYIVGRGAKNEPDGTHIARYRVTETNPPTLDFESEVTILRCLGGGHNGCTLEFGPDNYLYISLGDAADPTPPDPLLTGQDVSDLLSSILRINVDAPFMFEDGSTRDYTIPDDNPFVKLPNARGEVYAYGFRNPWRMSFDKKSGELWVGDVGWEAFEMVYRVKSGGNYGWSIKEGPGDALPSQRIGPTPVLQPDITLPHSEAASVTGGYVYHGDRFPTLKGKYIFGDWITRRFWAAEFDAKSIVSLQEIAYGEVKPIGFALDHQGEVLVLEYIQGTQPCGIYRFTPNPAYTEYQEGGFPKRLSETGLFRDVKNLSPNEGVTEYQLNSNMWMDGAEAEYHLAVPGADPVEFFQSPQPTFDWFKTKVKFPKNTVLSKTYSVGHKPSRRRLETQISHYGGPNDWRFYTYRWLDDQSDAELVNRTGESHSINLLLNSKEETSQWNFGSQSQCRICHTPWSGDALGFLETQLRRPSKASDSWRELLAQGYISVGANQAPATDLEFTAMAGRNDMLASLDQRARSYLQSNCAHCHQFGGNGAAAFDVRFEKTLAETKTVDALPMKGNCELANAKLIAAGHPERSVLFYRTAKSGSGRMPHVGPDFVDTDGARLLYQWIRSMPQSIELRELHDKLTSPMPGPSKSSRLDATKTLLGSIEGAVLLANSIADNAIPQSIKSEVLVLANEAPANVRDIVEPFLPIEQRAIRLGTNIDKQKVLGLVGDAAEGKRLVLSGVGQCLQCHKVGDAGKEVGPSFEKSAAKYKTADAMLEQLMQPSLVIAPEYRSASFRTDSGETIVGRILSRTEKTVVIVVSDGAQRELAVSDIEAERESDVSLMPAGLLAPLTPKQASDIIAYLLAP